MAERYTINRDFSILWAASLISQTGDVFYAIALAWMLLERTRSPAIMGAFLVASQLPGFLVSPWAGAVIDRLPRKRILVAADLVRGSVLGLASLLLAQGRIQLWQLLAVAVLLSLAAAFFNPTARVVIPRLVPGDRLVAANAAMQAAAGATAVAGPLLGAVLLGGIGYLGAFVFNAASFFLSAGLILGLGQALDPAPAAPEARTPEARNPAGIREGFRFIRGNPRLRLILAIIFSVHLCFGSLAVVLPFLANRLPGRGILNLGFLEAALGAGILAGSAVLNLGRREPGAGALFKAVAAMGAGLLAIGASQALGSGGRGACAGAAAVIGVCVAVASIHWTTLMQQEIPDRLAGRVFAVAAGIGNLALPVAYGACGLLLRAVSLDRILLACGAALIAVGLGARAGYAAADGCR